MAGRDERTPPATVEIVSYRWRSRETEGEGERREKEREIGRGKRRKRKTKEDIGGARIRRGDGIVLLLPFSLPLDLYPSPLDGVRR